MTLESSAPIYLQVASHLRHLILSGQIAIDQPIPTEAQLVKEFHTTRTTVRAATQVLAQEGLIETVHGMGSFVRMTRKIRTTIWNFGGFSDRIHDAHTTAVARVIHRKITDQGVFELVRLRGVIKRGTEHVFARDISRLRVDQFPGIDELEFENVSLHKVLRERFHVDPSYVEMSLHIVPPQPELVALFEEPDDVIGFRLARGTTHGVDGDVIEEFEVAYSSSVDMRFNFDLDRRDVDGI